MFRDPRELPLIIESMQLWRTLGESFGAETGYRTTGIMYLCATADELAANERWLEHARPYQLDSRIITGAEVAKLAPGTARTWAGALYTASDGGAEPGMAAPAIAEAARRHGATILTGCAVRGIETAAGRVSAAVTERGPIDCQAVVLAGGAWSRLFCGSLGIDLPQLKVLASVLRTAPLPGGPDLSFKGPPGFGIRRRRDGGYTVANPGATVADIVPDSFRLFRDFTPVLREHWRALRLRVGGRFVEEWRTPRRWPLDRASPFERVRVLDPAPTASVLDQAQRNLAAAFPAFEDMRVAERWAGLIDVMPDEVPVIGPVESLPGFFLATGFSGHGFGIGPGAGRLMADLVAGDRPVVDPAPFRLARFGAGAKRSKLQ
jgi:glycine/D-amino acid oxidase-like deaminating enzyme